MSLNWMCISTAVYLVQTNLLLVDKMESSIRLKKVKKFRQFLHEKAGEKNWTFWIDSERVNYLSQHSDRAKWIKQLKNKYIRNGSPMQLPTELLLELGITRSFSLSEDRLFSIQASLLEALKSYWYPSFLVHLQCAQQDTHKLHLPQMSYIGPKPVATCAPPRSRSAGAARVNGSVLQEQVQEHLFSKCKRGSSVWPSSVLLRQ